MKLFSVIYTVFALVALLLAIELYLTAHGKPFIPADFWQSEMFSKLLDKVGIDSKGDATTWTNNIEVFLSVALFIVQLVCVVPWIICSILRSRIMKPLRNYSSIREFRAFTRSNLLLYAIGEVFFWVSCVGHCWGVITFAVLCLFTLYPLFHALSVIFKGMPESNSYCASCNYGSLDQFRKTGSEHLHDNVTYATTTTSRGNTVIRKETRETGRERVYRDTYTCVHCGSFFKQISKR